MLRLCIIALFFPNCNTFFEKISIFFNYIIFKINLDIPLPLCYNILANETYLFFTFPGVAQLVNEFPRTRAFAMRDWLKRIYAWECVARVVVELAPSLSPLGV